MWLFGKYLDISRKFLIGNLFSGKKRGLPSKTATFNPWWILIVCKTLLHFHRILQNIFTKRNKRKNMQHQQRMYFLRSSNISNTTSVYTLLSTWYKYMTELNLHQNIYSIYNKKKHVHSVWRLKSIWINDDFFAFFFIENSGKISTRKIDRLLTKST